jgi:molybdopterin-guanine dinucleotide biosynthesis protein A
MGGSAGREREAAAHDAIVLAGGAARRLGGTDKPALRVGGATLLDRVLDACEGAAVTVVVGPPRRTARPVVWTREDPPGGGPLPALAAGLDRTTAERVLVFAADLPFLTPAASWALLHAVEAGGDGAVFTDADGRDQPLAGAYRTSALRGGLDRLTMEHTTLSGLPLRRLTARLTLARLPDTMRAAFDCDTWQDLSAARSRIREHGHVLDEWIAAAKADLGIDLDVDTRALLDLAREAAHGVARPAAPLTTFLVGYAAATAGGGPEAVAEATRKAVRLARRWAAEQGEQGEQAQTNPNVTKDAKDAKGARDGKGAGTTS